MKTILLVLLLVTVSQAQTIRILIPILGEMEASEVTATVTIIDPNRNPETPTEIEFYEGYGIVFEADARDEGPICLEREGLEPIRRCITLGTLRELVWESGSP